MIPATMTAMINRFDLQFFTAYWLPAFTAVLGSIGLLVAHFGLRRIGMWVVDRDSVEQGLCFLIALLVTTMFAFILRALRLPITELYSGAAVPRAAADWLTEGQHRARNRVAGLLGQSPHHPSSVPAEERRSRVLGAYYPREEAETRPTLLGNVIAAAADQPRIAYGIDGAIWWPRLAPVLPDAFRKTLGDAQAPMMALLNLSVVFAGLAIVGGGLLALGSSVWPDAVFVLIIGLVLSRECYRAAVSQAVELAGLMRVAFDL